MTLLHLGGHLIYFDVQNRKNIELELNAPTPLTVILDQLGIPTGEIYLAVVNGEIIPLEEAVVKSDDRIDIFPPMGGG